MFELLQYEFIQNAVAAGILTSIACGIIGSLVVVNRIVFISGGIAHAAYGGIGLAFFLGISPLIGAGFFAVMTALFIGVVTVNDRERADTIIGLVWAAGMAIGIILIDFTPGYNVDLMSYLFGSILTVPRSDLIAMIVLDSVIIGTVLFFYHEFLAVSYDREFAKLRGIPVRNLYLLMLCLVAITVVMMIQVVGLILVIALLTIPTYIAEKRASSLAGMMVWGGLLSMVFTISGLWLSYLFNITSGASIILVASFVFLLFLLYDRFKIGHRISVR